jgi:hypothetical protein
VSSTAIGPPRASSSSSTFRALSAIVRTIVCGFVVGRNA